MKIFYAITLIIFIFIANAFSENRYVKNTGNDTLNGTTNATAWSTIAKVNNSTESGDNVYFLCGDTWREQLIPVSGTMTDSTIYASYGTGAKPLLLGSYERNDIEDWIDEGSNIWSATIKGSTSTGDEILTNPSFDTNTTGWSLYRNTATGTDTTGSGRTTTEGEYDSAPGGYKLVCVNNGTSASDIQLILTGGLSITAGKWYKLTYKAKASEAFSVTQLTITKNSSPFNSYYSESSSQTCEFTTDFQTFTIYYLANTTATSDVRIYWALGNIIPDGATLYIDTVSFKECSNPEILSVDIGNIIFDNEASCGVKVKLETDLNLQDEFWYDETNDLVKIYSVGNPAIVHSAIELALKRNIILENSKSNIIYENLDLRYGGAHGIGGSSTENIWVKDCDFSYIGGAKFSDTQRYGNAIEFYGSSNNNLVERCRIDNIYDTGITPQGNGTIYNSTYKNNIISNYGMAAYELSAITGSASNIHFIHNTCFGAGSGWANATQRWNGEIGAHLVFWQNTGNMTNCTIKNNVFENATAKVFRFTLDTYVSKIVSDYNSFYDTPVIANVNTTDYTTLEDWQSATGQDLHSIVSDPMINSTGFPQTNSPVIDAGTDVGVTTDYRGVSRSSLYDGDFPDIGAYERKKYQAVYLGQNYEEWTNELNTYKQSQ